VSAERRQSPEGGWGELTVDELKSELEARGLTKSGKKGDLVARLDEDDAAGGAPDAAAEGAPDVATSEAAQEAGVEAAAAADADEAAAEEVGAEDAAAEVAEEAAAEDAEPADEEEAAPAKRSRRRRGSAETGTSTRKAPARRPEEAVLVRARARYVRTAPRKARLVMNHIRGKRVEQAQAILVHAPRDVSGDILKLLNSAVANAESAYELGADELTIRRAFVDEGPTIKRFRPRALGRATKINKRTSHMTIELTTDGNGR
jgi:ribosomal protein L22